MKDKKQFIEILNYLIFGILTTVINIIVFTILNSLDIHYLVGSVIAWLLAVLFAFYTNKKYVFKSNNTDKIKIRKEIISFYSSRVFSLLIDLSMMYILISLLARSELFSKIIVNVVVIAINYILSKWIIFKEQT